MFDWSCNWLRQYFSFLVFGFSIAFLAVSLKLRIRSDNLSEIVMKGIKTCGVSSESKKEKYQGFRAV